MKLEDFRGLMAPVFTPFKGVDNQIDYDLIPKYTEFLKSKKIRALLVNGTTGEGTSMNLDERKKVTEKWWKSCEHYDMLMMVQITGCSFSDAIALAKHAESLRVHGVLCLPELYFKPKTADHLVKYLKNIAVYCPNTPIYYYHIPMFTQLDIPMPIFMELAKKEIPNFAGIKFTSGDLSVGIECLKFGQVFLGADTILCGALALGFENAIMTTLNMHPEMSLKIIDLMENRKVKEARNEQLKLNQYVKKTLKEGNNKQFNFY
jgi:N-acetylneuraminate lyase